MKTPKVKKLILCIALAIAAGVFLFAQAGYAGILYYDPESVNFGYTTTNITLKLTYTSSERPMYWSIVNVSEMPAWLIMDITSACWPAHGGPAEQYLEMSVDRSGLMPGQHYSWTMKTKTGNNYGNYYEDRYVTVSGPQLFSISGVVRDENNQPVSGVTIYRDNAPETTTNSSGTYSINVLNGVYSVKATNKTYPFVSKNVTIDGSDETCNFYAIGGSASYNEAGVASADIYVNDQLWTLTAADGSYEVEYLPSGSYTITAEKLDYTFDPFPLTITNVSRDDVHFYTYDIYGYIRRHDLGGGEGINGVNVRITGGNAGIEEELTTTEGPDGPGYYKLEHVGGGTYTIEAQNPPVEQRNET